jgi:REase_MTES_1575
MLEMRFVPDRPFTRAQALKAGLTDLDLTSSTYRQVFWGVYISASVADTLLVRALAAVMIAPKGAVVSHHTAAQLWGGVPPDASEVHLSLPKGVRSRTRGVRPYQLTTMPEPANRRGLPVTGAERTFCDMARWCDLVQLVVLGDSLVKAKATSPRELRDAAARWEGRHKPLLVRAAALVRKDVDSPMESRVRMLMVLAGLLEPTVNHRIEDDGRLLYRIDLSFPEVKLAIEFDGRQHVEKQAQWESDVLRREDLEADDWTFVVITGTQLYQSPDAVLARVMAAMRTKGLPIPRRPRSEWKRHFVGRDVA